MSLVKKLFLTVTNPNLPKILAIGKNYVKHVKVNNPLDW